MSSLDVAAARLVHPLVDALDSPPAEEREPLPQVLAQLLPLQRDVHTALAEVSNLFLGDELFILIIRIVEVLLEHLLEDQSWFVGKILWQSPGRRILRGHNLLADFLIMHLLRGFLDNFVLLDNLLGLLSVALTVHGTDPTVSAVLPLLPIFLHGVHSDLRSLRLGSRQCRQLALSLLGSLVPLSLLLLVVLPLFLLLLPLELPAEQLDVADPPLPVGGQVQAGPQGLQQGEEQQVARVLRLLKLQLDPGKPADITSVTLCLWLVNSDMMMVRYEIF